MALFGFRFPVGVMRRWGRDFSFGDGPGGLRESLYGKHQPFIGAYFPDRAFAEQYATCISGACGLHGDRLAVCLLS